MENDDAKLWRAVYDVGSVFSVEIDRNVDIEALRTATSNKVFDTDQHAVNAHALTLYKSQAKNGEWLRDDREVRNFLRRGVSAAYEEMRPSWTLEESFGEGFSLSRGDIHVLVKLPETDAIPDDVPHAKRRRVERNLPVKELWRYCE
ncbi:hypothetical protein Poli38472_012633 [Pythium oligandrum]|uniref:Crinkler effector protein N-terminal domain-containing protein n=1 Tax=Pythium oligandrum TaxID=41045 RepID=A0A8K1FJ54_PYTOL|nr:hypothetical protein Poli38472_012633 [Pythium oligandrum]|eukprot:TMW61442.1 hypothetical protein Poli38472_012633 [Pythium oligandrum]